MRSRPALVLALVGLASGLGGCDGTSGASGEPVLVFGRTGVGPGEFSYPRAAVATPDGRIYVVDKVARVQCYSQAGEFLCDWRTPAKDAGKPTGLGLGPDGTVYVADTHYARVLMYDAQGGLLGSFGSGGEGPGEFKLPSDVAVDSAGYLFVSEFGGNDRISKFTPDRQYLFSFGDRNAGEAQLERPQSLLIDPEGVLWVADGCNHRICRFDRDGHFLGAFGRAGNGLGELRFPYGLDRLSDGTLVVCEYGNNRVQFFTPDGRSLGTWGVAGRKPGELAYPWAAVVGRDDRIFILDSGNNRVQVIDGRARGAWRTR